MSLLLVLGIVANLAFIVGGVFRRSEISLSFCALGALIYIFYYIEIELYSPISTNLANFVINLIIIFSSNKAILKWASIAGAVFVTGFVTFVYSSPYDILVILAALCVAFSNYNKHNYILFKSFIILSSILWITYALRFDDYAMLVTATFIIISYGSSLIYNLNKDCYLKGFNILSFSHNDNIPVQKS